MKSTWVFTFVAVTGLVASTATSAQSIRMWSPVEAERVAGRQVFLDHCAACHVAPPTFPGALAPSLVGVVGRPAASETGFPYSIGLKTSGIIWTEDNLRKWIADSNRMVPKTLMPHVSVSDPVEQLYLLEYLKTLKSPRH